MAAITDGSYYIVTEVGEEKWYLTQSGYLTNDKENAYLYGVSKVTGGALYDVGILLEPNNGAHYSNTTLTNNLANLHPFGAGEEHYRQDGGNNRNDWERQVFYLNAETGKFAIRSCNTSYGESSWADAGRAFWTYDIAESEEEGFSYPVPCYSYEAAYVWELELPAEKDQLRMVLEGIYNSYENQILDDVDNPEFVNMGTEYGQLADWETWRKFKAEVDKLPDLLQNFYDEDYDPAEDPNCPDLDGANTLKADVDSMWQVILNSEVPYKLPQDGYYRIHTRMLYYTDTDITDPETGEVLDTERTYVTKAMLASYDKNHENKAMFGTLKKDMANFVWKLTQVGDSILMQNVGMGTYVSSESSDRLTLTADEAKISHVMFDYAANDAVVTEDDEDFKDIFYIRLANQPRHAGRYVHQNGHSRGKDSHQDLEMGFWNDTYNYGDIYDTDGGTSEWYLEPVAEEDIAELIEKFELIKNHDVLVQTNQELRDEVLAAMTDAKDIIREDLIASASQLSSPNSDEAEGTNIGNLIDGDGGTFWHTSWHNSNNYPRVIYNGIETHYLEISGMENLVGDCELYFRERANADNDRPTKIVLMGINELPEPVEEENYVDDLEGWEEIAVLTIPHTGAGEENTISFHTEKGFSYVRLFAIEVNSSFRTFWHVAEIQLSTVKDNPNSRFVALGELATNLEKAYNENCAIADDDIDYADYQKLLEAYELFKGGLVDPTELRDALKKYAKVTEGVVEGTEPGQWASVDVPKAYDRLYAEAKAYNEGGRYTVDQIHKYAAELKAMSKSVAEQANGVKTDKWYRIMFPTEEMYDKYGFDKSPADKTSLRDDQAIMFGTFATSAVEITEEEAAPTEEDPDATVNVSHLEAFERADVSDVTRMYFMAEDEITDKDLSKFRFVERPQEKADYAGIFSEVMENSAVALDLATSYTRGDALITDVAQLSSNASDEAEGKNIGALIDGDKGSFWHSDWHQKVKDPHYLQVAFNEPVSGLVQVEVTRRNTTGGGHILHMYVQGSEDAENWTNIGYMVTPWDGVANSVATCQPIDLGADSYKYLRFILGRRSDLNVELDPFAVASSASVYNKDWSYFHAAEFQIYPVKADKELGANAKALQETYNSLHKVANIYRDATAEQFATAKKAYATYQTEYNTSAGKAILPNGADKPAPTYAIQNKATGLFIKPNDGNTNDIFLKLTPTFFSYTAPGYERSLLFGTNLNGNATNYLHAGESNRRLCTWTSSEAYSNSALVIREAEAVEPADFEFNLSIKTGEIYDFCSTVPVTNKGEGVAYVGLGKYADADGVTFLALKKVETIEAGAPAFYILEDTTQYDAEVDAELVKFSMPAEPEFKLVGDTINGFMGCLVNHTLGANDIFFDANYASATGKTGYYQPAPCVVVDIALCPEVDATAEYDFAICLDGEDNEDGIKDVATVVKKISQPGDVYSVDGKLLKTGATLNSLKSLGKGMYILNGVKVAVK